MRSRAWIYTLFFISGAAGLIYQVVWIRQFGNVFGNTVHSASLVSAIFVGGLGIGSLAAGRWADRAYRTGARSPLVMYGRFEVGIALLGLLLALLLPQLEGLSSSISSYVPDQRGWLRLSLASQLFRYGIATVLLLPITVLMGGTLTLLVRHLVHADLSVAGVRIGWLYGINTAGAALGCFLTDFALIPSLGLFATQTVAVVFNLIAGLGALRLARTADAIESFSATDDSPPASSLGRTVTLMSFAVFAAGFVGMALEILWFRQLITSAGSYRAVLSILLSIILVGIWWGSIGAGYLARWSGRPLLLYVIVQTAIPISAMLLFYAPNELIVDERLLGGLSPLAQRLYSHWTTLRIVLFLVGVPALLMGFTYPLANTIVQHLEGDVGRRAGAIYLANTLGAVAGALTAGFVLLPSIGTTASFPILALFALAGVVAASFTADRGRTAMLAAGALALLPSIGLWYSIPAGTLERRPVDRELRSGDSVVAISDGAGEAIGIIKRASGEHALITNGHVMSRTGVTAQRYMRAFAHVPLLSMDHPRRVLVICFGVGNTSNAATLHPSVERVEIVDLSAHVLEQAHYFADVNRGVLEDPKVIVHVNDGRQHLRMQPEGTYDLITLEPPPIAFAGVAALYSREFYELARSRLKPGGHLTQWLPAYQMTEEGTLSMVRAFLEAFPSSSVLLSGYGRELIMMAANADAIALDPVLIEARINEAPAVRADLQRIEMATTVEIAGSFIASNRVLHEATEGSAAVTDDYPIMEYAIGSNLIESRLPSSLFRVDTVEEWCPGCSSLPTLPAYLEVMAAQYHHPTFLEVSWRNPRNIIWHVRFSPEIRAAIDASPFLLRTFGVDGRDPRGQ